MHEDETRALRRAALILLVVSSLRWAWSARAPVGEDAAGSVLPELLEATDSATQEGARRRAPLEKDERIDPNRASDVELDRLPGVGPATARAIVAARDSGAVFRKPEDLLDVRGIGEATLARMRGALDLDSPPPPGATRGSGARRGAGGRMPTPALVDLNRADVEGLQSLPGIGPALAARIIAARQERLFITVDDLERVPGVGPSTIERVRARATVGGVR